MIQEKNIDVTATQKNYKKLIILLGRTVIYIFLTKLFIVWDPLTQYRHDYPPKEIPRAHDNDDGYKLRQSHFKLGDDKNPYLTTSMIQNRDIENCGPCNSALDENAKNDLRKSHFNLGNNKPNFETTFRSEYYDKSQLLPKDNINSKNIEKMLRAHNYEFGDDKPNYISEAADRYTKPKINPNDIAQNRISNQLLQKSNYQFGNNNEPWNTTQKRSYTPKYSENDKTNPDLVKTNFILGDDKPDFKSINSQTYKSHPYQFVPVDKNLINDLRSHHYKLGNVTDPLMTQNQVDFKDPTLFGNNYAPTLDNNLLRRSHFQLGDALPSEIYNTTYKIVHTPKKATPPKKNTLRNSAINLVGNNPMTYLTDYRDNYVPKQTDLNNKNDLKDLMNHIRKSHFNFGDMKNDFSTTSGNAYKFDPDAAKKANSKLNNDLLKDLQSTHYKLGYDNDVGISTQKKDYIPYGLNENKLGKINPGNNFNFGDTNKFDGISIYKSDYVEKEIPADGNDCWC